MGILNIFRNKWLRQVKTFNKTLEEIDGLIVLLLF